MKSEIVTGPYGSASEVVLRALRHLEERQIKLNSLRLIWLTKQKVKPLACRQLMTHLNCFVLNVKN
ncbi:type II toxin-antitoxin system ParD family antitoxin [Glaciecola punicea]|uniref:type II toxin-antitoxin system ParD family antitoxin n=1 Tax=Glaciecola punicea TaxID=56804 RepID=UPI0009DADF23|nr:type II toxin-antitoxin system ParD family antitoxin [Glaciecola punicea]